MGNTAVFKDRLIAAMRSKGLTQAKLGELMNVNQATISRWLNGKREPDYQSLIMLCGFLEESPNSLLGYNEEETHKIAFEAIKNSVLTDIDFQFIRGNIIAGMRKEGKSEQEINETIEKYFQVKLIEFCKYYNFVP